MGYACPVCEAPQMDAGHLANHLAFTALLGDEAHEAWLDEHAPGWGAEGEAALADRVVAHAPEREFPQVFEDTVGERDHDDPSERSGALFDDAGPAAQADAVDRAPDEELERVLSEARELTRRRRAGAADTADDDADEGAPGGCDDADGNG